MRKFFHYTDKDPSNFKTGMWRNSSYTDVGTYSAFEACTKCGISNVLFVIEFDDDGLFTPNHPSVVQPVPLRNFIGGAKDYIHPGRPIPVKSRRIS